MLQALKAEGLAVTAFQEPEPTDEFRSEIFRGLWIDEMPFHCVIEALKVDGLDGTLE